MEEELDQDTTSALDGIVGSYDFSKEQLKVFEELVRNMRGAAWGIAAATSVTVVLSATKQARTHGERSDMCISLVVMESWGSPMVARVLPYITSRKLWQALQ